MPRVHRKGEQSSEEKQKAYEAAIVAIKGGQSIRNAAEHFGIPKSTLQAHYSKLNIQKIAKINRWQHINIK